MNKKTMNIIVVILVVTNLLTLFKVMELNRIIVDDIQNSLYFGSELQKEISNIYSNVEKILNKQGSILESYDISFGELDKSEWKVPVTFCVNPKEFNSDSKVSIILDNENIPMEMVNSTFIASSKVYIFDDFNPKISVEMDGVQKRESLEYDDCLVYKYIPMMGVDIYGESSYDKNVYQQDGEIILYASKNKIQAEKITVFQEIDGEIIDTKEIEISDNMTMPLKQNTPLEKGQKLFIYAIIEDNYKLQYKYLITMVEVDDKGDVVNDCPFEFILLEICDEKGNVFETNNIEKFKY
ncbi:MAG: hypothetical protein ACOWWH_14065 [Eubacteriaceae bacterium]